MNNYENLIYTYKHRKVVMFLGKLYFDNDELIKQLNKHDMDKMFLLLFYEKKNITKFHSNMAPHHDNDIPKKEIDYIEMVLDWESARYTKEDKPLNAYDTMINYYPHLKDQVLPILEKMDIAYSTFDKDKRVVEYVKSLGEVTIEDIKNELINYIKLYKPQLTKKRKIKKNPKL